MQDPPKEDVDGLIASFAPFFVESSPAGVNGGANDQSFRKTIPQGYAAYRKAGATRMEATKIAVAVLDPLHTLASVDWDFDYKRPKDGKTGRISFTNLYVVSFADGSPKIFAYMTPDEQQAMNEHGLA